MIYDIGDIAELSVSFTDIDGVPANPTTITLSVQAPDGTVTLYDQTVMVQDNVGVWHFDLTILQGGLYLYSWTGTGAVTTVEGGSLTVRSSPLKPTPSPVDLCNLDDLKNWLDVKTSNDDRILARLITSVSQGMLTETGRKSFGPQAYLETRNGNGTSVIAVREPPILEVASVSVDGSSVSPSANGSQVGWVHDQYSISLVAQQTVSVGGFRSVSGPISFSRGFGNVMLSYSGGYESVPSDVEQAVIEWCATKYIRKRHIDQDSISLGNMQVLRFARESVPKDVQAVIDKYRRRL